MADLKQIKVGNTTYNIEPYTAYLPLTGGTINAGNSKTPLILKGGVGNYREGLRIIPTSDWSTIVLGGNDIGESEGTSTNSWSLLNNNGSFYISKNGANSATTKLSNTDGTWRVNDNMIIHSGNIGSQNVNYANSAGNADTLDGDHSSAFAKIGAHNNLTASGNEFTFASDKYSGPIYLNWRTAGGTNGNITEYILGNGAGGQLGTIIHSGNIGSQNVNYANSAGNADTLDGKHSSDFYLSSSNITNLPINGGIYWNPYVESSSDGSDAASITVIQNGNGNGGTVLQIKQANDANDIVNVVAGDLRLNGTSVSTSGHTHDDRYYTESEVNTKLNGKSDTGHTHSNYVTTDTEQTISGKKTFTNNVIVNSYIAANAVNTSYISYINNATGLKIVGPWGNDDTQAILELKSERIKAYRYYDDGGGTTSTAISFIDFPSGVKIDANGCTLTSSSTGWELAKSDDLGSIYPGDSHFGRIGKSNRHFYQGYINYFYSNSIYPSNTVGTGTSNVGCVGTSNLYFSSGAFKTVYRTSESGLSDIRSKQNISNNDLNALDIINNLNIINFQYDDDVKIEARNKKQRLKAIKTMQELPKTKENKELRKELQKIIATPNNEDMITIGVSAQQLQELLPKKYQKTFIQKESTNQYADQLFIRENRLVYLSFKAIQEQQAIIGSLEEKINLLEEKINALEEKMKKEVN